MNFSFMIGDGDSDVNLTGHNPILIFTQYWWEILILLKVIHYTTMMTPWHLYLVIFGCPSEQGKNKETNQGNTYPKFILGYKNNRQQQ